MVRVESIGEVDGRVVAPVWVFCTAFSLLHVPCYRQMRQRPIKPYTFKRGKVQGGGGRVTGLNVARHHLQGLDSTCAPSFGAVYAFGPDVSSAVCPAGGPQTRTTFVGDSGGGAGAGAGAGVGAGAGAMGRSAVFDESENARTLERMEDMLERMDTKMKAVEDELGAAAHHDKSMGLLMDMVGKVMETYD